MPLPKRTKVKGYARIYDPSSTDEIEIDAELMVNPTFVKAITKHVLQDLANECWVHVSVNDKPGHELLLTFMFEGSNMPCVEVDLEDCLIHSLTSLGQEAWPHIIPVVERMLQSVLKHHEELSAAYAKYPHPPAPFTEDEREEDEDEEL